MLEGCPACPKLRQVAGPVAEGEEYVVFSILDDHGRCIDRDHYEFRGGFSDEPPGSDHCRSWNGCVICHLAWQITRSKEEPCTRFPTDTELRRELLERLFFFYFLCGE